MRIFEINLLKKTSLFFITISVLTTAGLWAVDTVKIMPLGDSITYENYRNPADSIPDADRSAYRNDLDYLLNNNGYTFDFVGSQTTGSNVVPTFDIDHEGYNGETDAGVASNVYDYLTINPADIVLLHIGTNSSPSDNSADEVESILNEIDRYEVTNSTHVKVALARIIGCWEEWVPPSGVFAVCTPTFNAHLNTFNNNVQTMVEARIQNKGDDIIMVDMQSGANFNYNSSDMIDDLHPNDIGYEKIATAWYSSLEGVIPAHQWKLEESNATTYSDSYRDFNDGVCTNPGCPIDIVGVDSTAKVFDGIDDNISMPHNSSYDWNETESFSVEFWIKPFFETTLEVAIGHYNINGSSWWVGRDADKIRLSFGSNNITSAKSINNSGKRWTHVAVVRNTNDNTLKLYINGEEDIHSLTGITPNTFEGNDPLNIGFFNDGFNFHGALDEITIYNGVLNKDQIKLHHDRGNNGSTFIQHNWLLNEPTGVSTFVDQWNPSTNAIAVHGGVRPTSVIGQIDNAQSFDGSTSRLTVADDNSFDWDSDKNFSIELWVKPDVTDKEMTFIGRRGEAHPDYPLYNMAWYLGLEDDGKAIMFFRGEEFNSAAPFVAMKSPNPLNAGTWYHLAVVRNTGNTFTFYIDGVEVGNAPDTTQNIVATTPMTMGFFVSGEGNVTNYYNGSLDDIAIFGAALTAAEIKGHYNKGKAGLGYDDDDTNIPVITLIGSPSLTLERATTYTDAGATAVDDVDGDISSNMAIVNPLDENIAGSYLITYNVVDAAGNDAIEVNRTITVVDTTAPTLSEVTPVSTPTSDTTPNYIFYASEAGVITYGGDCNSSTNLAMLGENNITFNTLLDDTYTNCTITITDGEGFTSNVLTISDFTIDILPPTLTEVTPISTPTADTTPEYTFLSNEAGTITYTGDCTSSITTAIMGNNIIIFDALSTGEHSNCVIRVTDAASNEFTELNVSTFVVDDIAPVITRIGDETISLLINQTYIEAGATCTDNYDAACSVTIGGDVVDTSAIGNFTITYNVNDTAGNSATTLTRTVNVAAGNAPVITVHGDNPFTVEVNTPFIDPGVSANDLEDGTNLTITSDVFSSIHTNTLGTQTVTYTATDSQDNVTEANRTVEVVDTTKPVIVRTGDETINLLVYETYTEESATCTDNYDTVCAVTIGGDTVNTSSVGTYTVTYDVTDTEGNIAIQVSRTIHIADTSKPVITLTGTNQILEVGTAYTEEGATATDNADGSITANIIIDASAVDVDTVGSYTVTYNVNDSSGNIATQVKRFINVVDTTKPIITLTGTNSVNILLGGTYTEEGATCTDNYDASCSVTITGTVNTGVVGNYQLTYSTTDSEGNIANSLTRTVNITTANAPQITVLGDNPVILDKGSIYAEQGVSATDAEDGTTTVFSDFLTAIDTSSVGPQTLTYFSTDSDGNTALATRTIIIRSNIDAVIKNDFNADGIPDIVWRTDTNKIYMWLMNADGTRTLKSIGTIPASWSIKGIEDFNNDGIPDIVWRTDTNKIYMWLMNADGTRTLKSIGTIPPSWSITSL